MCPNLNMCPWFGLITSIQHAKTVSGTQVFQLPPERIWVSVFENDDEAYAIWRDEVQVPESRIVRMGAADNFWAAGATGVCSTSAPVLARAAAVSHRTVMHATPFCHAMPCHIAPLSLVQAIMLVCTQTYSPAACQVVQQVIPKIPCK